jgi:ssDNA thymidine ADP-ribosyltransferase, DarT
MNIDELVELIVNSSQHNCLYHFTDEANFPSIAEHGLLSKAKMRGKGWSPQASGGNELSWSLDRIHGIDPYVSLCMTRNHGMKYLAQRDGRLPNPKYLGISPNVLKIDGVKIAFGVANANNVEILLVNNAIERIDIEVIYKRTDWTNPEIQQRLRAAEKFEVLVPDVVPRDLIVGIF